MSQVLEDALYELRAEVLNPLRDTSQYLSAEAYVHVETQPAVATANQIPQPDADSLLAMKSSDTFEHILARQRQRLASLGFTGSIHVDFDRSRNMPVLQAITSIVLEITNNIMKHGEPGRYVLTVVGHGNTVHILAANAIRRGESFDNELIPTPESLRFLVDSCNGTICVNTDDGEWTMSITIPVP